MWGVAFKKTFNGRFIIENFCSYGILDMVLMFFLESYTFNLNKYLVIG